MPAILVVEQDPGYAHRIVAALESAGYSVSHAGNQEEANQAIASMTPTLVLANGMMPGAKELLGRYSRRGGGPGSVVLLPVTLANHASPETYEADETLSKPFSDQDLERVVKAFGGAAQSAPAAPAAPATEAAPEAPAPAAPTPPPTSPAKPPAQPKKKRRAAADDDIDDLLDRTLSGLQLDSLSRARKKEEGSAPTRGSAPAGGTDPTRSTRAGRRRARAGRRRARVGAGAQSALFDRHFRRRPRRGPGRGQQEGGRSEVPGAARTGQSRGAAEPAAATAGRTGAATRGSVVRRGAAQARSRRSLDDDDIDRKLEETLSGVLPSRLRRKQGPAAPKPATPKPSAPEPAAPEPTAPQPAAPAQPSLPVDTSEDETISITRPSADPQSPSPPPEAPASEATRAEAASPPSAEPPSAGTPPDALQTTRLSVSDLPDFDFGDEAPPASQVTPPEDVDGAESAPSSQVQPPDDFEPAFGQEAAATDMAATDMAGSEDEAAPAVSEPAAAAPPEPSPAAEFDESDSFDLSFGEIEEPAAQDENPWAAYDFDGDDTGGGWSTSFGGDPSDETDDATAPTAPAAEPDTPEPPTPQPPTPDVAAQTPAAPAPETPPGPAAPQPAAPQPAAPEAPAADSSRVEPPAVEPVSGYAPSPEPPAPQPAAPGPAAPEAPAFEALAEPTLDAEDFAIEEDDPDEATGWGTGSGWDAETGWGTAPDAEIAARGETPEVTEVPEPAGPGAPAADVPDPELVSTDFSADFAGDDESGTFHSLEGVMQIRGDEAEGSSSDDAGEPFGDYRLLERVAVGGMAEVWRARRRGVEGFQKTVAIKRILHHLTGSTDFITMFIDEAKLAAQLSHANIIQIYDLGKVDDDFFIAMEFVDGKDLRSILKEANHQDQLPPLGLTLMIVGAVARALDYAHRKRDFEDRDLGLVHRDVSPQNVLISYEGEIKLCDFGIAKAVAKASTTQMGALKGKLQYMSPEQAWGKEVDARSDIFSLGSVFWETLTGKKLFTGESEIGVLDAVRDCEIGSVRQVEPTVPEAVDRIVAKALAKAPDDRYQTAGDLASDIKDVLEELKPSPGQTDLSDYLARLYREDGEGDDEALPSLPQSWDQGDDTAVDLPAPDAAAADTGRSEADLEEPVLEEAVDTSLDVPPDDAGTEPPSTEPPAAEPPPAEPPTAPSPAEEPQSGTFSTWMPDAEGDADGDSSFVSRPVSSYVATQDGQDDAAESTAEEPGAKKSKGKWLWILLLVLLLAAAAAFAWFRFGGGALGTLGTDPPAVTAPASEETPQGAPPEGDAAAAEPDVDYEKLMQEELDRRRREMEEQQRQIQEELQRRIQEVESGSSDGAATSDGGSGGDG